MYDSKMVFFENKNIVHGNSMITHINIITPTIRFFATIKKNKHVLILIAFSRGPLVSSMCDIFVVSHYVSLYEGDTYIKLWQRQIH